MADKHKLSIPVGEWREKDEIIEELNGKLIEKDEIIEELNDKLKKNEEMLALRDSSPDFNEIVLTTHNIRKLPSQRVNFNIIDIFK